MATNKFHLSSRFRGPFCAAALKGLYYFGLGTATTIRSAFTNLVRNIRLICSSLHRLNKLSLRTFGGGALGGVIEKRVRLTDASPTKDESRQ